MITAIQTKREIAKKKARVAYLVEFVTNNGPLVQRKVADGYFGQASEAYAEFALMCDEVTRLNGEIQQLSFDLEGQEAKQAELQLTPAALVG